MKKQRAKSQSKGMKDKVKAVAGKVIEFIEPRHNGYMQNVHASIKAAYAELNSGYKKAG